MVVVGQDSRSTVVTALQHMTERDQLIGARAESRVPVAVAHGQFGNPGKGTSAAGISYQRGGEGKQYKRAQCICTEL
jgi:hypothetical protein